MFLLAALPSDGGLIYKETNLTHMVVEPWNAFSSLAFIVPALLFIIKLQKQHRQFGFLLYFCAPLLILGGVGSTLYHAFRASFWLLLMDVLPILILTLGVSIYFWWNVLNKKFWILVIYGVFTVFFYAFKSFFTGQDLISANYILRGTLIFLPCLLYLKKRQFNGVQAFITSILMLSIAIWCRYLDDKIEFLPMGTHFLWHIFCAAGAYYLGLFITESQKSKWIKNQLAGE